MYSASIVDSAISVWSFDPHVTGTLPRVTTHPVRLLTQTGSSESSTVYSPAKSASAYRSNPRDGSGRITVPQSCVPFRYRPIRFTAFSCDLLGSIENLRHWLTANAMSGLELVAKYCIIPRTER